ncbi:hypothetical protein SGLAM104S_01311 [Streptomyces glaucescens]
MMATAQLGITVSSLVLGAVAEPAIAHLMEPVFEAVHMPHALVARVASPSPWPWRRTCTC